MSELLTQYKLHHIQKTLFLEHKQHSKVLLDKVNPSSETLITFKIQHVDYSFVQVTFTVKHPFTVRILRLVNRTTGSS